MMWETYHTTEYEKFPVLGRKNMTWFLLAILGYFLYALVTVLNKFLLCQRATTKPLAFTFWIGILSIFTFILVPFGQFNWPGWPLFLFDILIGLIFFAAIWYFYEALDINEASRVTPLTGGLVPVFILALSYVFLSERLNGTQILAFCLLVFGGVLISLKMSRGEIKEGLKGLKFIALSILLSAVYMVLIKYAFDKQGFINAFVWSRVGVFLASFLILLRPAWRRMIFSSGRQMTKSVSGGLVVGKILAGVGSLFVHLAVLKGSVTLVNAIQGVEYVFLLALTVILSLKFSDFLEEKITVKIMAQKIMAILLIGGGLLILSL